MPHLSRGAPPGLSERPHSVESVDEDDVELDGTDVDARDAARRRRARIAGTALIGRVRVVRRKRAEVVALAEHGTAWKQRMEGKGALGLQRSEHRVDGHAEHTDRW